MKKLKEIVLAASMALSLGGCASSKYVADLDSHCRFEKPSNREVEMYEGKNLVAKKVVTKGQDDSVYDLFEKGKKIGRLYMLPTKPIWKPASKTASLEDALKIYRKITKGEDILRNKYRTEFE